MGPDKILIAFFSMTGESYVGGKLIDLKVGNTDVATKIIADFTGAERFEIKTVKTYPSGHMNLINVAKEELNSHARPAIVGSIENMGQYDTIILGYPNWWGTVPMPVATFLEGYDFTGKTMMPLCTNEGSGMGTSEKDIAKFCPTANMKAGLSLIGGQVKSAESQIVKWLIQNKII